MICNSCGRQLPDGTTTCPYCLFDNEAITRIHDDWAERSTQVHYIQPETKRAGVHPGVLVGILAGVALVMVAIMIILLGNNSSNNTSDNYGSPLTTVAGTEKATDFSALVSVFKNDTPFEPGRAEKIRYLRDGDNYKIIIESTTDYNIEETEVLFDQQKRILSVKQTYYSNPGSEYQYSDEYKYNYNQNGQLITKNYYSENSSGTVKYDYDEKGNCVSEVFDEFGPGWYNRYSYDDVGFLVKKEYGGTFGYDYYYEYSDSMLTAIKQYNPEMGGYENIKKFNYTPTGKLAEYCSSEYRGSGELTEELIKSYVYDTSDRLNEIMINYMAEYSENFSVTGTCDYSQDDILNIHYIGTSDYVDNYVYKDMPIDFAGLLDIYIYDISGKTVEEYYLY